MREQHRRSLVTMDEVGCESPVRKRTGGGMTAGTGDRQERPALSLSQGVVVEELEPITKLQGAKLRIPRLPAAAHVVFALLQLFDCTSQHPS